MISFPLVDMNMALTTLYRRDDVYCCLLKGRMSVRVDVDDR